MSEVGRSVVSVPASAVHREEVTWLEAGRVPLGMVTILAGVGGLGKSTFACALAASNPGVTLFATAEDSLGATVRPRLEAAGADLERVHFVLVQADDGIEEGLEIPADVHGLDSRIAELGASLLVIDPLTAHLEGSIDTHKDAPVRRALSPLYRIARDRRCAVVPIVHLNKAQGLSPLSRLSGSGAFGNAARSVLLLDRDPDDVPEGSRRILAHVKCNVAPLAPSLLYEVASVTLAGVNGEPEVSTSRLELLGESAHDARSILASLSADERSKEDEATVFLLTELEDGERHPAKDVRAASRALGISEGSLDRARKRLGVETKKSGYGGGWEMWLPNTPTAAESSQTPEVESSADSAQQKGLRDDSGPEDSTADVWSLPGDLEPEVEALKAEGVLIESEGA